MGYLAEDRTSENNGLSVFHFNSETDIGPPMSLSGLPNFFSSCI